MNYSKITILLILLFIFSTALLATQLQIGSNYNYSILSDIRNLTADIQLVDIPMDMYKPTRLFRIAWTPTTTTQNAKLYYSNNPSGGVISAYTATNLTGTIQNIVLTNGQSISARTLTTSANSLGLGVGRYFCVIHDPTLNYTSIEFQLIIEAAAGVTTLTPNNGSVVSNNPTPTLSWQPIAGVPYYHIIVSDQPFTLEYDDDDKLVVSGLNLIWQAITSNTSIMYGSFDPSNNFNGIAPPPLINGKEYNWIVMSNFGNEALYSSDVTGNPSGFVYNSSTILPTPVLSSPLNNANINNQDITFQWDPVTNAVTYQLFLYEKRMESGSEVFYPVWNQITTNNLIDFNATSILIQSAYVWKVVATNENNVASVSSFRTFNYSIPTGTLNIKILTPEGAGIGYASAIVNAVEGSMDNIPLTVNELGREKKYLPVGSYILNISKNGYEPRDTLVNVLFDNYLPDDPASTGDTKISVTLQPSPSTIIGSIRYNNLPLSNVTVKATNTYGVQKTAFTSNGNYIFSLTAGLWTITALKEGYSIQNNVQVTTSVGQTSQASNITMLLNSKNISGYTKLPSGSALASVTIKAQKNNVIITKTSNNTGYYSFTGLELGQWSISWEKTGYTAPNNLSLSLTTTSQNDTPLSDAIMNPRANVISGNTSNGTVGLGECLITATPQSGNPISTISNSYGNFTLNLPNGTYSLTSSKAYYTPQNSRQINVNVGETVNSVNFVLFPNLSVITGSVTNNNNPIAGVLISAGNYSTQTDVNGNYSLSVDMGSYSISASKTGYITATNNNVVVTLGQTTSGINFSLNPNPGVISGKALLSGTGVSSATIKGVRISGSTQTNISPTTTDANGNYSLNLIAGEYSLYAVKTGMISNTITVIVAAGNQILNKNITLQLNQASITGTVFNDQSGIIRNATVQITENNNAGNSFSTVTNVSGVYSLTVPAGVKYNISVSKTGFSNGSYSMSSNILVGTTVVHDFTLTGQSSSISGKVYDQYNNPLVNATVTATKNTTSFQTSTGSTGNFTLSLSYGNWSINASKPGYTAIDSIYYLNPGEAIANKKLVINTNFAQLTGRIISSQTNSPLANATVSATNSIGGGASTTTNPNGDYNMTILYPGNYSIGASKNNYQTTSSTNINIPGNSAITRNFSLTPLTGSVNLTCNQTNATITVENTLTGAISIYTTSSSTTNITGLLTQVRLRISVSKANYYPLSDTLTLQPNTTQNKTFNLIAATGSIQGRIVNSSGDGLPNVTVNAYCDAGFSGTATTSANGSYTISNLQTNNIYHTNATLVSYFQPIAVNINLQSANPNMTNQNITLQLNNISISGTIRNQNQSGATLANIPVKAVSNEIVVQTTTNSLGQYTLAGLSPNRTYTVSTEKNLPGWENASSSITPTTSITNHDLSMQVHISSLSGTITNSQTSQPIAGASVTVFNSVSGITRTTTSSTNGNYSFTNVYNGTFSITVSKESHQTKIIQNIAVNYNQAVSQNVQVIYSSPVTISGTVKDTNNRALSNISINLNGSNLNLNTVSNSQGVFTFDNVTPYSNNIAITTTMNNQTYDNNSVNFNTTNVNISNIALSMDKHNATVSGSVNNSNTPLNNANVKLKKISNNVTKTVNTTSNGLWNFSNLYEGDYLLTITCAGFVTYTSQFALIDGQVITRTVNLNPIIGALSGVVINSDLSPLQNAKVFIYNSETNQLVDQLLTEEDGGFTFNDLTADQNYNLSVTKTGYINYNHPNTLSLDSTFVSVELNTYPNSLIGTIYNNNAFVSNATIKARNIQGNISTAITDEVGDYVMFNLIGYHVVWAYTNTLASYQQEVSIPATHYKQADFNLLQASNIPGKVTYNNQGMSGVNIIATNINSGRVFATVTNSNGKFNINGLPSSTFLIQASIDGYNVIEGDRQMIVYEGQTADSLNFSLSFTQNSISGSAFNFSSNEPINGVSIELKQGQTLIDETTTGITGTFLFQNLIDGNYTLYASHGAFSPIDPINVNLTNGISSPSIIQFLMHPVEKYIYGQIINKKFLPLENVTITASIGDQSYSATSDSDGNFSLHVPNFGLYSVIAQKEYYYPSSPVQVNLTQANSTAEVNYQLSTLPAKLAGTIMINDKSNNPSTTEIPQQLMITLSIPGQDNLTFNGTNTSSFYFDNIDIPFNQNNVLLQILCLYENSSLKNIASINLTPGDSVNYNYTFDYLPGSVSLNGYIQMKKSETEILPISSAKLYLRNNNMIIDSTLTAFDGFYQFNTLTESTYSLDIKTVYDFEEFNKTYNNITWTGENLTINHTFDYILASYKLKVVDEENAPVSFANVLISSEVLSQPISLITDSDGIIQTNTNLHTGIYQVKVTGPTNQLLSFINPNSFELSLSTLTLVNQQIKLPIRFDQSLIIPSPGRDSVTIYLKKSSDYNDPIMITYVNLLSETKTLIMSSITNSLLKAVIPPQNKSGNLTFYFTSTDTKNYTYSNQNEPFNWTLTSEGILSDSHTTISPSNPLITYNQQLLLEIDVKDELDNSLNNDIDQRGIITWSLADSTIGTLISVPQQKRKRIFKAPDLQNEILLNQIKAKIKLDGNVINKAVNIKIKELRLAELIINGQDEFSNSSSNNIYNFVALSDSGEVMNVEVNLDTLDTVIGEVNFQNNQLTINPSKDFIGIINLNAKAKDPNFNHEVKISKELFVYKIILPNNVADTLYTGLGCILYLPQNMIQSGESFVYIKPIQVAPVQQFGTAYDVFGNVFQTSVSGNSNFDNMPVLGFTLLTGSNNGKTIAYWDSEKMRWTLIDSHLNRSSMIISEEIPGWYQYALMNESLKLGLYDLKLLPNPFTPYDNIGSNKGLQIAFKVSSKITRYPKITCKIYNLNGTLVRTIVDRKPYIKGDYKIGESSSLYWNGRADNGSMARNGRYVIQLIIEDASDKKEYIKPVVLIK